MALWFTSDKIFACWLALILYGSTLYYYFLQSHDPLRCQSLLSDGFWLDPVHSTNWQPDGCMIRMYKPDEISTCFDNSRAVFIGGNRTKSLFETLLTKADAQQPQSRTQAWEANSQAQIARAELSFFWDTALNGTEFRRFRMALDGSLRPTKLAVVGFDDEFVRNQMDPNIMELTVESAVAAFGITPLERARRTDNLVVLPALMPNTSLRMSSYENGLANVKTDAVNDALWKYSDEYDLPQTTVFHRLPDVPGGFLENGHSLNSRIEDAAVDILLNYACNDHLPKHYPYSSTCCNSYPRPSWTRIVAFAILATLLPAAIYLWYAGHTADTSVLLRLMPEEKYLYPLLTISAITSLCWFCDRTNIFEKGQKHISPLQFFALTGLIVLGSLFTLSTSDKDLPFLNRDQTDEWKGWMQVAILVYHYVGVSKIDWIYSYMRVCPTSYLFMTGFGHTVYFLRKDDYSFKRVSATMLRLNLLNALLAYTMGNDWLLYYFAPLVTWNFFVVYLTLWVGHQHNDSFRFILGKIVVVTVANFALYHVHGVLESIWTVPQSTFKMQGDLREWRFRITLDQYSIIPGMLVAVAFLRWDSLVSTQSQHFVTLKRMAIIVAALAMPAYAAFEATLPSKFVYNKYHPFTGWIPCVAFVVLRNSTPWFRRTHSTLFAWFGRGSLETFLLQFHVWLAADTAGLLVVPGLGRARALNAVITTSVFLWVASKATEATGPIIAWIMAEDTLNGSSHLSVPDVKGTETLLDLEQEPIGWWQTNIRRVWVAVQTDYRVRVGILLGVMVILNWTY